MKGLFRLLPTLAFLVPPALADEMPIAQRPVFHVGDRFSYADRFETIACRDWEVREVDPDGNPAMARCGDYTATYAPDGAIVRIAGKDGRSVVAFSPEAGAIPFPLQVGRRWQARFEVSTAGQMVSPTIDESCEAAAIETVTVGGAPLQAFRIACTDRWSVAFLSGSSASTLWYAPDARAVVKALNAGSPDWNLQMTGYAFN